MPFVYRIPKNTLKNKKYSLQVQSQLKKGDKERVSLCSTRKGSLTIEAAIILPLFLLIIMFILYFLLIMIMQMNIQIKIEESARKIAKDEFLTHKIIGYSLLTLSSDLLTNEFRDYLDSTVIIGGANGVSLLHSSLINSKGIMDIVLTYEVQFPLLPGQEVELTQRCRFKTWIGSEIVNEKDNEMFVYITDTGKVYHTNRNCTHLLLSIKKCLVAELDNKRNDQGIRYKLCDLCKKADNDNSLYVYITNEGDKWHRELGCSGLKRSIKEISIQEINGMPKCTRCLSDE